MAHECPGLSHWRKRIGDQLDTLLQENLRIGVTSGPLMKSDLGRLTVGTTVSPKNLTLPTDAEFLETAVRQLAT